MPRFLLLRRHGWLLLLLAVVAPLLFFWTWNDQIGELGSDAPDYMVMARHFATPLHGDRVDMEAAAQSRFPPLYPMLLAALGGADDLLRAHAVTTSCLIAALIVLVAWLGNCGLPPAAAALMALLFALLPDTWLAGLRIQSEYLYLLLSLLALSLLARFRNTLSTDTLYTAALIIAAAALTRTIGLTLLFPLTIVSIKTKGFRALAPIAAAALPLLAWQGVHHANLSYGTSLAVIYGHEPAAQILTQLQYHMTAYWNAFRLSFLPPAAPPFLAGLILLACTCCAVARLLRLHADALYLLAYVPLLLVWPYPEEAGRLLWPALPILLSQPILVLAETQNAQPASTKWLSAVLGSLTAAVLWLSIPSIALAGERYRSAQDLPLPGARGYEGWYHPDLAHAIDRVTAQLGTLEALQAAAKLVPESDCIVASRPSFVSYAAHRRSVFPPLNSIPDPYFLKALTATGCHYVFMYSSVDGRYPVPLHPLQRLPQPVHVIDKRELRSPSPGQGEIICMLARID